MLATESSSYTVQKCGIWYCTEHLRHIEEGITELEALPTHLR